jgi:hypothetical protein
VEGPGAGGVAEAGWLMNRMMPLVLACAGHSSNDVSQAGMEFVTAYINSLKRSQSPASPQAALDAIKSVGCHVTCYMLQGTHF